MIRWQINLSKFSTYWKWLALLASGSLVLTYQNCARMEYENPNGSGGNTILGDPTGGTNSIGGFAISGVSGDNDTVIDSFLTDGDVPTFHWSESLNAEFYSLEVRQGSVPICKKRDLRHLEVRAAECSLSPGAYVLYVTSYGHAGSVEASAFPFTVEVDTVGLSISSPQVNLRQVLIPYVVTSPENLGALSCRLIDKKTNYEFSNTPCTNLRERSYSNLAYGDYIFIVDITDRSGRRFSRQREFTILAPNCDPLSKDPKSDLCEKRLKANVYFHPSTSGTPFWNTSGEYIASGILKGTVYLSQVFIPTRDFTLGFPGISDRNAFFGMDITTKLKVSSKMTAGNYQLALLADDGASLYSIDENNTLSLIVNNEGDHPTRMACSNKPFALADKVKLRLTYFQSRPNALALVMLYRPWTDQVRQDCEPNEDPNFFGLFPVPADATSWPGSRFQQLLDKGWKVVPTESFEHPDL